MFTWINKVVAFGQKVVNTAVLVPTRVLLNGTSKLVTDMGQNADSQWDPARLIGYGWALFAGIQFLISDAYMTWKSGAFDTSAFSQGTVAISGAICAAAIGVRVKNISELPTRDQMMQQLGRFRKQPDEAPAEQ